jgi:hypothetical protein
MTSPAHLNQTPFPFCCCSRAVDARCFFLTVDFLLAQRYSHTPKEICVQRYYIVIYVSTLGFATRVFSSSEKILPPSLDAPVQVVNMQCVENVIVVYKNSPGCQTAYLLRSLIHTALSFFIPMDSSCLLMMT